MPANPAFSLDHLSLDKAMAAYDREFGVEPVTISHATGKTRAPLLNVSWRKVGGLRFLKIGRFTFMFCVSAAYRPFN